MTFKHCSLNGKIIPSSEAKTSVFNIEYSYGFGVYETLRVIDGIPYFLTQHLERLETSARTIHLEYSFTRAQISQWIGELMNALPSQAYNLKILLIGAPRLEDVQCWMLPIAPKFPEKKWYQEGVGTITVSYERALPQAKTLNMLQSYLAYSRARENNCYDALLVDHEGNIREGTRTNFFMISGNTITKPPKDHILDGVMQRFVLSVARANSCNIIEAVIPLSKLSETEGAFLTSTSSRVMPIRRIDEFVYPSIVDSLKTLMERVESAYQECKGVFPL